MRSFLKIPLSIAIFSVLILFLSACSGSAPIRPAPVAGDSIPADALWVATTGDDTLGTGTSAAPFKTFAKSFSVLQSGGTLVLKDGVFSEPLGTVTSQPTSGSVGKLTTIRAQTDGGAVIDAQAKSTPLFIGNSYIRIQGIKFLNGSQAVADLLGDNLQVLRSAFGNAGAGLYDDIVNVSGNDVLIEDSWMWGRGKVGILVGTSDTNDLNNVSRRITLRRIVIRLDSYTGSLGYVGVVMYGAADTVIENVMTLDFNTAPTTFDWKGGFRSRDMQGGAGKSQRYYGTIALNLPYDGYRMSDSNYENAIAWDVKGRGGFYEDSWLQGYTIKNATVGATQNGGIRTNTTAIQNSFYYNVSGGNSSSNYGHFLGTDLPNGSTNAITTNTSPKYIVRVEKGSPGSGTGAGGADRGANILNRYQNGALTSEPLWSWRYEDRIKRDFQTDFGLDGVNPRRGFAADTTSLTGKPTTLTSYIWEYLGNPCPADICK